MFYRPPEPHGLKHNPFNAQGHVNLAPLSYFNALSYPETEPKKPSEFKSRRSSFGLDR